MRSATPPSEGPAGSSQPADEARDSFKTKRSGEKNIGSTSGFRLSSTRVGGLSTPYQSEIGGAVAKSSPRNRQAPSESGALSLADGSSSRYRSKIAGRVLKTPEPPKTPEFPKTGNILKTPKLPSICRSVCQSRAYRSKVSRYVSKTPEPPDTPEIPKTLHILKTPELPKTPEIPKALGLLSPCCPPSQSSLQWWRSSVEKKSASLSGLEGSLPAAEKSSVPLHSSQQSTALALGTHSDPSGGIHPCRSSTQGHSGVVPDKNTQSSQRSLPNVLVEAPLAIRKCMENPELFKIQLPISDDEDESDKERQKPGSYGACSCCDSDFFENAAPSPPHWHTSAIQPIRRSSGYLKMLFPSKNYHKNCCSSSVTPQSSVHKASIAKAPTSGMHKKGAYSNNPRQLQQQCFSERGHVLPKASRGARAEGAALGSSLPCKTPSMKSDPGGSKGAGLPKEDKASGRKPCRASLEERNPVLRSRQPNAQQGPKDSQHSKKSILSLLLDAKLPKGYVDIEINGKMYHMVNLIGRGGSSKVFMMLNPRRELCAVKLVSLANLPLEVMEAYKREVTILKELRSCDRVVHLLDSEINMKDKVLALVMEKGDQDLSSVLMNRKEDLDPVTIKFYWSEMLLAVKEIHKNRVVHSDLKPANFIFVAGKLKLIDFGIADKIQEDVTSILKESPAGTLNFMSPESIKCTTQKGGKDLLKINLKSDVWSLGCILYNLVYGKTPFQDISSAHAKLLAIADSKRVIDFPPVDDPHLLDVMKKCLNRDPLKRPTIPELLGHPYLLGKGAPQPGNLSASVNPHVQSLISEIENLSPASTDKVKEVLKSMKRGKP